MFKTTRHIAIIAIATIGMVEHAPADQRGEAQATFESLGVLDDRSSPVGSFAQGVSADGAIVVGTSFIEIGKLTETRTFLWTEADGMTTFDPPPNTLSSSMGAAVSADGSVIAGGTGFVQAPFFEVRNGVVWQSGAPTYLESDVASYIAEDVADDGSVVVGVTRVPSPFPEPRQAFRWTPDGGLVELGVMPNGFYTWAKATSADGSVIVGHGDFQGTLTAFRWTQASGLQPAIDTGGEFSSEVGGLSPDGNIMIGRFDTEAMYWTSERGVVTLGELPNDAFCLGEDLAADGSIIVGSCLGSGPGVPFMWTPQHGLRDLATVLTNDYGIDLTGWTLQRASAISDDGTVIVGTGISPNGWSEAWRVVLPASVPADVNADGVVNVADLLELLSKWGPCPAICVHDLNSDGAVDVLDLLELLASWG